MYFISRNPFTAALDIRSCTRISIDPGKVLLIPYRITICFELPLFLVDKIFNVGAIEMCSIHGTIITISGTARFGFVFLSPTGIAGPLEYFALLVIVHQTIRVYLITWDHGAEPFDSFQVQTVIGYHTPNAS